MGAGRVVRRLAGMRRVLGVAMDNSVDLPGYKWYRDPADGSRPAVYVAFLDVEEGDGEVNGVCLPLPAGGWAALDARERNYERVEVTGAVADPPGRVWAYRGSVPGRERLARGLAEGRAVVARAYLEAVEAGFAALGDEELCRYRQTTSLGGIPVRDLERIDLPAAIRSAGG
ncbi:MAG: hypothetical protein M3P50_00450 [Actinomycetota bacterium]|nr:hypothetical protein [Actinomycetota bacterium]